MHQRMLGSDHRVAEDPDYLSKQLITYLGNKRSLLDQVGSAVASVKRRLGKKRLRILDAFAGSGIVSRFFKAHSTSLVSNDLEDYAVVAGRCYLRNQSTVDAPLLRDIVQDVNASVENLQLDPGFIQQLYSPRDETNISKHDRVFYTRDNARRLDDFRRRIDSVPEDYRDMLLAPLLAKASVHANTSGVFKGFYKDRGTKIGKFGGSQGDALTRIKGRILLEVPVLSRYECDVQVTQGDANQLVRQERRFDLAYFDPPYNQHPYGSNYFMLNLLVHYEKPENISQVSGIPVDWQRSGYNVRSQSPLLLEDLIQSTDSDFLLVSFNNEGFITPEDMRALLQRVGTVEVMETRYNAFRGSRNLRARKIHVTEQLFLVQRH